MSIIKTDMERIKKNEMEIWELKNITTWIKKNVTLLAVMKGELKKRLVSLKIASVSRG